MAVGGHLTQARVWLERICPPEDWSGCGVESVGEEVGQCSGRGPYEASRRVQKKAGRDLDEMLQQQQRGPEVDRLGYGSEQ